MDLTLRLITPFSLRFLSLFQRDHEEDLEKRARMVWTAGCVERSPRMGTCTVLQGSHSNTFIYFCMKISVIRLSI